MEDIWMPPLYYLGHKIGLSIKWDTRELCALMSILQNREVIVWMEVNDYFLYDDGVLNDKKHNVDALCVAIVPTGVENLQ